MDILEKALEKSIQDNNTGGVETSVSNKRATQAQSISSESHEKQRLAKINWEKLSEEGFLSREQTLDTSLVEEYRMVKRPLINNAFGRGSQGIEKANLILITSSLPGEGKTFSAINLAISIANERDKRVLLIDADVAKPSIAKRLGINSSPGLIEFLENDAIHFSDICLKTDLPGLQIIPAGKRHAFSTELLSSDKMLNFVEELSKRYPDRLVIFDSPPLLAATQAEVLATLVGQVVLVISAENTMQNTVQDAMKKIETSDVVLALLNKSQQKLGMDYYGYGQYGHS